MRRSAEWHDGKEKGEDDLSHACSQRTWPIDNVRGSRVNQCPDIAPSYLRTISSFQSN
jgi:hypothetical protein